MIHYTCDYCGKAVAVDLLCLHCQALQDRATKSLHVQIERLQAEENEIKIRFQRALDAYKTENDLLRLEIKKVAQLLKRGAQNFCELDKKWTYEAWAFYKLHREEDD
jgi:seryl-tRNA synthetase